MTTVYADSPYGMTQSVSGNKQALTSEWLQQFAAFTNGGTIPFWIRYQYKVNFIITGGTKDNPTYGGWGPLDETVDKINAIPGLRILLPIQQFPQFMLSIDGTGKEVGYGDPTAVLPKWDIYATVSAVIAQRYGNRMHMWQIGNEEYDIQAHNGAVLAPVFNAAYPAIRAHSSSPIIMGAVRKLPPGGSHVSTWMNNFVNYVPKISAGESPQAIPDGIDFHYYRDGSIITNTTNPAPDSATTDNSANPGVATVPSVPGEYAIIRPILDGLSPGIPIMNLEFGWDLNNNAAINSTYPGTTPPWYVSRYTLTQFALSHFAGVAKSMQFTIGQYTDAKSLHRQGLIDMANYIAANPQYTPGAAPPAYLYQTIDRLDYEGTVGTAPPDQYFAITNVTGSNKAWSVTSNQSWLTVATLPTNGIKGTTGAGLTSGTLTPSQQISLKAMVDSTQAGLTTLTTLTATLTVTVGANVSTIAVNLWVNPNDAVFHITIDDNSFQPTATVNGSNPAGQVVHIKNAGNYAHNWYAYTQATWLSLSLESGTLAAGATQAITISADITGLAPGNYLQSAYFCLTPFPPQYKNSAIPANPQYVNCLVNLKVTASTSPAVQLSTNAMYFTAGTGGATPGDQQFFINNCTKSAQDWTVSAGTYTGGGTGWLTLTPASGNNLPASGSETGTSPNVQSTDYKIITASVNSTALAVGTHTATITATLGVTATQTITVTYEVTSSSPTEIIGASPTTVTAPSQVQGGTPVTATTILTNTGNTAGIWTKTKTYISGTGWLTMNPGTGSLAGSGGTQVVTFTCTPGALAPSGTPYSATVVFTLGSTTATVTVNFTVTSAGSPGAVIASPPTLNFTDTFGQGAALPQSINLTNTGGQNGNWTSSIIYKKGNAWISLSAPNGTINAGATQAVSVTLSDTTLATGTYTATLNFSMGTTSAIVSVTLIIFPAFVTTGGAQMTASDLATQYQRIMASIVGPQLSILATTYYGGPNNNQVVYGELDALFPWESMAQLHVMKSINDVTSFLNAYAYTANVLSDNPIVYYRLGETSGIFATDISGRNMTGTLSNTLGIISGVTLGQVGAIAASSDTAMLFDGATGNITLPAGVTAANWSNLTVEVWIKPSNVTFTQTAFIVANDAPLSTNLGFMIAISKNAVIFRIGKNTSYYEINQPYTFAASTWYHLAAVFAGTSLTVYLNGNQIAATTVASALVAQTTNQVNIAAKPGSTANNFPGTLQHPALYKKALSAVRIQAHYLGATLGTTYMALVLADGAQAYYRLNETSGTTAFDSTANHFDAQLVGTSLTYSQVGIITADTAIGFGANDELIMPTALGVGTWGAISLEYWINLTSGYQHIVIAGDSNSSTIYLNGAPYTSGAGPDTVVVGPDVIFSGSFAAGTLSQVSIYKYVLSAAQVANHYQVGSLGI